MALEAQGHAVAKHYHVHNSTFTVRACSRFNCEEASYLSSEEAIAESRAQALTTLNPVALSDAAAIDAKLQALAVELSTKRREAQEAERDQWGTVVFKSGELPETVEDDEAVSDEEYGELIAEVKALESQMKAQEQLYKGWPRYFGGAKSVRIHSRTHCWKYDNGKPLGYKELLPSLSGQTLQQIQLQTYDLCSACFHVPPPTAEKKGAAPCLESGSRSFSEVYSRSGVKYPKRGQCKVCGKIVSITLTGKLRAHKASLQ